MGCYSRQSVDCGQEAGGPGTGNERFRWGRRAGCGARGWLEWGLLEKASVSHSSRPPALIRALRTAVEEVDTNREKGLHSCGWTTLRISMLHLHSRHGRGIWGWPWMEFSVHHRSTHSPRAKTQQPQKGQWKVGTGQKGVRAHSSRGVKQGHGTSCVVGDRNTPR